MQYAVIGHLHIMLALIAIMLTLIIGRWLNFKGAWHKVAMPLMILGCIVLNLGVWGVATPLQPIAHMIIYVGATPSMLAALFLLIWSWNKLIKEGTADIKKPNLGDRLRALLRDPAQVRSHLADALHEFHHQRHRHLHGDQAGSDLQSLAGSRGTH